VFLYLGTITIVKTGTILNINQHIQIAEENMALQNKFLTPGRYVQQF
jgi:hypothetical protein